MKTSQYQMNRVVISPTAPDKVETLISFSEDSDTRYPLASATGLVGIIGAALHPAYVDFIDAINDAFGEGNIPEDVSDVAHDNLTPEDVVRFLDTSDMTLHDVTRDPYTGDGFDVLQTGEWWKTDKRGNVKCRGKRFIITLEDGTEETWDLATDTRGKLQLKHYGIGAMFKLIQKPLAQYAAMEARDIRATNNRFCRVKYQLVKLCEGEAVITTAH